MAAALYFLLAAAALVALSEGATVEYQFDVSFLARLRSALQTFRSISRASTVC
jgi:hypothetical protein